MATTGGMYGAFLMGKKGSKAASGGGSKPAQKTAKVIGLMDTKDTPVPKAAKAEPVKGTKPEPVPDVEQTKREIKDSNKATDRHVPRSGHASFTVKKTDDIKQALEGVKDAEKDGEKTEKDAAYAKKRAEAEAEAEERRKKAEEDAKKMTFAEYQKLQEAKKAELGLKALAERKVDTKVYTKMEKMEKADEANFFVLPSTKAAEKPAAAAPAKKAEEKKVGGKPKFKKSESIVLGFTSKPTTTQEDRPRGPRRDGPRPAFTPKVEKTEEPAAEAAPEVAAESTEAW